MNKLDKNWMILRSKNAENIPLRHKVGHNKIKRKSKMK